MHLIQFVYFNVKKNFKHIFKYILIVTFTLPLKLLTFNYSYSGGFESETPSVPCRHLSDPAALAGYTQLSYSLNCTHVICFWYLLKQKYSHTRIVCEFVSKFYNESRKSYFNYKSIFLVLFFFTFLHFIICC